MESAGPRQVATGHPTLQVLVGSFCVGVSRELRNRAPTQPLGPWLPLKVTFGVGLEHPGDSDRSTTLVIVIVSRPAISNAVAEFRFETPITGTSLWLKASRSAVILCVFWSSESCNVALPAAKRLEIDGADQLPNRYNRKSSIASIIKSRCDTSGH